MNKRKRKKLEKRTVQYISKLRKTDKQASETIRDLFQ